MASLQSTAPGARPAQSSAVARYGFLLAVLSAAAALSSALGHRFGLWHYSVGFAILRWSAYAGMAAALISLVGAVLARPGGPRRGFVLALLGIIIGLAVPSGPILMLRKARQVPPIHDITTDTTDPPRFVAVLPLRAGAEDPSEYGGPEIAALQRKAYPQVLPLLLDVPPDKALEEATRLASAKKKRFKSSTQHVQPSASTSFVLTNFTKNAKLSYASQPAAKLSIRWLMAVWKHKP